VHCTVQESILCLYCCRYIEIYIMDANRCLWVKAVCGNRGGQCPIFNAEFDVMSRLVACPHLRVYLHAHLPYMYIWLHLHISGFDVMSRLAACTHLRVWLHVYVPYMYVWVHLHISEFDVMSRLVTCSHLKCCPALPAVLSSLPLKIHDMTQLCQGIV